MARREMRREAKLAAAPLGIGAFVGVDVSKKSLDACRLESEEGKTHFRRFANSLSGFRELLEWVRGLGALESVRFCLESTGAYSFGLASFLSDQGLYVSVENPRFVKHWGIAMRLQNKTDKADARLIARYARAVLPTPWVLADPELRELDQLLKRLSDLEELERKESNRLENLSLAGSARQSVLRMVEAFGTEKEEVLRAIEARLEQMPKVQEMKRAILGEPGVGELTALRILSHLGWGTESFQSAQQAAAAAGLNPVRCESGQMQGRTRISKHGPASLRGDLHMAAVVAAHYNPRVKAFYDRLLERGMAKLAAVTACARKLLMLCYGILKAHLNAKAPVYGAEKIRYTNLRGKQRLLHPKEKQTKALTI